MYKTGEMTSIHKILCLSNIKARVEASKTKKHYVADMSHISHCRSKKTRVLLYHA